VNRQSLAVIERAMTVMVLETNTPKDLVDQVQMQRETVKDSIRSPPPLPPSLQAHSMYATPKDLVDHARRPPSPSPSPSPAMRYLLISHGNANCRALELYAASLDFRCFVSPVEVLETHTPRALVDHARCPIPAKPQSLLSHCTLAERISAYICIYLRVTRLLSVRGCVCGGGEGVNSRG
jgi:hypothetical protein